MAKLITVRRAKEEIKQLQDYIDLAESYKADTLEKLIIKEYAFTNSIAEVTRVLNRRGFLVNGKIIEKQDVLAIIKSKPKDELHGLLRSGYLSRTKHSRNS
jgi:hypothetical protein